MQALNPILLIEWLAFEEFVKLLKNLEQAGFEKQDWVKNKARRICNNSE